LKCGKENGKGQQQHMIKDNVNHIFFVGGPTRVFKIYIKYEGEIKEKGSGDIT
jgi:hypothetical protein